MASLPQLTRGDRAYRREKIIAAYLRGACSRKLADQFSMSDGRIREIVREAGVSRPQGRPAKSNRFHPGTVRAQ